jgi:hypothetical protein
MTRAVFVASILAVACSETAQSPDGASGGSHAGNGSSSGVTSSSASVGGSSASTASGGASGGGGAGGQGGGGGALVGAEVGVIAWEVRSQAAVGGVPIVVNDASGVVVTVTQSDATAPVPVTVPSGGLVSIYPDGALYALDMRGVVDPPDGSTVTLHVAAQPVAVATTTYELTLTGYPPAASELRVHLCSAAKNVVPDPSGKTTVSVSDQSCSAPAINTFVVIAADASDQQLAWGAVKDIASNPGGTVPVSIAVDQLAFKTFTMTIAPIVATATKATTWIAALGPPLQFTGNDSPPASTASWSYTSPDTDLPYFVLSGVGIQDGAIYRTSSHQRVYASLPSSATFDPGSLAPITESPIDDSDPLHPVISWTIGAGIVGDAVSVGLFPSAGSDFHVLLPPTATAFRLPDVPASLPDYQPPFASWSGGATHVDRESASGWAEIDPFVPPPLEDTYLSTSGSPR